MVEAVPEVPFFWQHSKNSYLQFSFSLSFSDLAKEVLQHVDYNSCISIGGFSWYIRCPCCSMKQTRWMHAVSFAHRTDPARQQGLVLMLFSSLMFFGVCFAIVIIKQASNSNKSQNRSKKYKNKSKTKQNRTIFTRVVFVELGGVVSCI